jgi:hypothetical protein
MPRSRTRCSWGRTGRSAAEPERSTGGRTARGAPASQPPGQDGYSDQSGRSEQPRESREAAPSSLAAEACRAGRARGAGADQPPQRPVEVITQCRAARTRRRRQRAHHHERSGGQGRQPAPHEMPQPALHPVPNHGATDRATDHKAHFGGANSGGAHPGVPGHRRPADGIDVIHVTDAGQVHHDGAAGRPAAPPHRRREVFATGQPGGSGEQREIFAERQRLRPTPQADNSARPLRRRAARMARPARVRMRNRNPWVLARRRLFGWNVRLPLVTAVVLPVLGARFSLPRVLIAEVAALGTAPSSDSPIIPCRHGRHCCEWDSPGTRTTSGRGREHARVPAVGGRRPERRPPVLAPSKPASRVTPRATRRYIGGACLHGVLVAAPQAC